jgi:hypothetical protein
MASGHVNRTQRPNTWLHRSSLRREILLANSEPSTHGPSRNSARRSASVALGVTADTARTPEIDL